MEWRQAELKDEWHYKVLRGKEREKEKYKTGTTETKKHRQHDDDIARKKMCLKSHEMVGCVCYRGGEWKENFS